MHLYFDDDLGSHVLLFLVTKIAGCVEILISMGYIFYCKVVNCPCFTSQICVRVFVPERGALIPGMWVASVS